MNSPAEDPLLRSARREAIVVTIFGACALAYTVGYCSWAGFNRPIESMTYILGFPDWVFWGIITPWAICTIVACYFSYVLMEDYDLEAESALFIPPVEESSTSDSPAASSEQEKSHD